MRKALYVPVFPGEIGWELINYVPHVNYVYQQYKPDEVHVSVREGHEAFYPMATHFYPIHLSSRKSMGNDGPVPPPSDVPANLSKSMDLRIINSPGNGCSYFPLAQRRFIKYLPDSTLLEKWRYLPRNSVVLLVRGRSFGEHKNWSASKWHQICQYLASRKYIPIITGLRETVIIENTDGWVNLQGKTTFADLLAIMHMSIFVLGQSTGPAHFASLSGIPHAVWGSARIEERYLDSWNPHKTLVQYHVCRHEFECSVKEIEDLVDRLVLLLS